MKGTKTGGRRKGTPNRTTREVREFAQRLLTDPVYEARLKERLFAGELAPHLEGLLWAYGWGKPKDTIDLSFGTQSKVITVITTGGQQQDLGAAPLTSADQLPQSKALTVVPAESTRAPRPPDSRELDRTYGPPVWPVGPGRKPRW